MPRGALNSRLRRMLALPLTAALALLLAAGCGRPKPAAEGGTPGPYPDTLRVATLYSPLSYFIYREQPMGYDYDLVNRFVRDKGMGLDLKVAPSLASAMAMLENGEVDLIAYEVPVTAEYKERLIHAGPENITWQVLVQPKSRDSLVTDVTQLIGRDVYVEKDSKYYHRMVNLDAELGGGIRLHTVDADTIIAEDLIEMVSEKKIPLTVVDSDIARINATYHKELDISLQVSYPQRSAWGVAPSKSWLADSINAWAANAKPRKERAELLKRYFEQSKQPAGSDDGASTQFIFKGGRISPFDATFRRYAQQMPAGWDWQMLAAIGHTESRFDPNARSWAGARGVMQIMPKTAQAMGVGPEQIADTDTNIRTASKILTSLNSTFSKRVPDPGERRKFVLAAYNAGPAHVIDAIALARKYGKDPTRWDGHVAEALLMKANPQYYNDPVVKYGYCRGKETYAYVHKVLAYYDQAVKQVPK